MSVQEISLTKPSCPICDKEVHFLEEHLVEDHCFSHPKAKLFYDGSLMGFKLNRKPLIRCSLCDGKVLSIRHHLKSKHGLHEKSEEFLECISRSRRNKEYLKSKWFTEYQGSEQECNESCTGDVGVSGFLKIDSSPSKPSDFSDLTSQLKSQEYQSTLLDSVQDCFDSKTFADVLISCGTNAIPCHRVVLSCASPLMRELLRDKGTDVVIVPEIREETLRAFVSFIYKGRINLHSALLGEFMQLAMLFGITSIESAQTALSSRATEGFTAGRDVNIDVSSGENGRTSWGIEVSNQANIPLPADSDLVAKNEGEGLADFALINVGFEDYPASGFAPSNGGSIEDVTPNGSKLANRCPGKYPIEPPVSRRHGGGDVNGERTLAKSGASPINVSGECSEIDASFELYPRVGGENDFPLISTSIVDSCRNSIQAFPKTRRRHTDFVNKSPAGYVGNVRGPSSDDKGTSFVHYQTRSTPVNAAMDTSMVVYPSQSLTFFFDDASRDRSPGNTKLADQCTTVPDTEECEPRHPVVVGGGQSFAGGPENGSEDVKVRELSVPECAWSMLSGVSPKPCSVLLRRLSPSVTKKSEVCLDSSKVCSGSKRMAACLNVGGEPPLEAESNPRAKRERNIEGSESAGTENTSRPPRLDSIDNTLQSLGGLLDSLKETFRRKATALEASSLFGSSARTKCANSRLVVYGVRIEKPQPE